MVSDEPTYPQAECHGEDEDQLQSIQVPVHATYSLVKKVPICGAQTKRRSWEVDMGSEAAPSVGLNVPAWHHVEDVALALAQLEEDQDDAERTTQAATQFKAQERHEPTRHSTEHSAP
jgi:hypothetical protein